MRILVIHPVSINQWDELTRSYVSKHMAIGTTIESIHLPGAPPSIECHHDNVSVAPLVVDAAVRAERQGYNAVVISCFDDPGVDAARERTLIPVLGLGETSMVVACLLGERFAILSTGRNSRALYARRARELGLVDRLAYSSGIELGVLDLRAREQEAMNLLLEEGRKAIEDYGAEVLVLGCGGMIGFSDELSARLNVPVLDPLLVTCKMAEMAVTLGLRHSKAYLYSVPKHKLAEA